MAKILLIEPDILLAKSYATALKHHGHKVFIATGAQSAIDTCDKTNPDLIFLELQLSEHNGVEFLYEFRSYPEWQNVPVFILSIVPRAEFGNNPIFWKELAITDYYYKPHTSLRQILRGVDEALIGAK